MAKSKYTIEESLSFAAPAGDVEQAARQAIDALSGKIDKKKSSSGHVEAQLDKKLRGRVLGDRSRLELSFAEAGDGTQVALAIYPVDPVGRPLLFGARKGATRTALDFFLEELNQRVQ
jgi:hypothetical protein